MTKFKLKDSLQENKLLTSFSIFFVFVFVFLGIWQIERAAALSICHIPRNTKTNTKKIEKDVSNLFSWRLSFSLNFVILKVI